MYQTSKSPITARSTRYADARQIICLENIYATRQCTKDKL